MTKDRLPTIAVVVGVPRANDQSNRAVTLLNTFALLMASKRFDEIHGMYADHAPRIAAKVFFDGASHLVAIDPKCRRACRNAANRCGVPMLYWDASTGQLVVEDKP